jgi:hypothetical protein
MPVGGDGAVPVLPEAEEEPPADAPADAGAELEPDAPAADEESGAELAAACELPAVDALPLLAFPPQPSAAIKTATKSEPPMSKERRCIETSQE